MRPSVWLVTIAMVASVVIVRLHYNVSPVSEEQQYVDGQELESRKIMDSPLLNMLTGMWEVYFSITNDPDDFNSKRIAYFSGSPEEFMITEEEVTIILRVDGFGINRDITYFVKPKHKPEATAEGDS